MSTSNKIWALMGSLEVDNKYDELQSLIDLDRSILQSTDNGNLPIHIALRNPHITLRVVQLLLNGWPESISQQISQPSRFAGMLPLHCLCGNKDLDDTVAVHILTVSLEASPGSVEHRDLAGDLPIHAAAKWGMSPEVLMILVQAYPESVQIPLGDTRTLPIHRACESDYCRLDSVGYLLNVYPESINAVSRYGWLPIHFAAYSRGAQKANVINYLLVKDPTCATKTITGGEVQLFEDEGFPLHFACKSGDDNLPAVQLLYDIFPEAILKAGGFNRTPLEWACEVDATNIIAFLEAQLVYAEKAQQSHVSVSTLDENGWTLLHRALKENASLGSIKLLIKGNAVLRMADYNMAFPLHIACEFSSVKVVQYLMGMLDERTCNHLDVNKDSILHYACRGGNCEVVKYLLEKRSPHVSERNADGKLPIHLLCESGSSSDSLEHTDTIYRLLLAYPGTIREYM